MKQLINNKYVLVFVVFALSLAASFTNFQQDTVLDESVADVWTADMKTDYFKNSVFAQKIPQDAKYTRETRIGSLRNNIDAYSTPIYRIRKGLSVPLVKVVNRYSNRTEYWPIPNTAQPNTGTDSAMIIIDYNTYTSYEFWDVQWNSSKTQLTAGGMKDFNLYGTGISDPPNQRVTAGGFAGVAGEVLRDDLTNPTTGKLDQNMRMNRALAIFLNSDILTTGYVPPAVGGESSGSGGSSGIPLGTRFTIPRDVNVDSLSVHPFAKILLKSIQEYGIYAKDGSSNPPINGKYVATISVEPTIIKELWGVEHDVMVSIIQQDTEEVISQYGLFKVTGGTTTTPPPTPPPSTQICGNGIKEGTEVCDDNNTVNGDQCSSTCANKCTAPQTWNGTACVTNSTAPTPVCKADYVVDGIINIKDFAVFASNYGKSAIDCKYDIVGNDCRLNIADFSDFASKYLNTTICKLPTQ